MLRVNRKQPSLLWEEKSSGCTLLGQQRTSSTLSLMSPSSNELWVVAQLSKIILNKCGQFPYTLLLYSSSPDSHSQRTQEAAAVVSKVGSPQASGIAVPTFPNLGTTQQLLFQDAQDERSSCNSTAAALCLPALSLPCSGPRSITALSHCALEGFCSNEGIFSSCGYTKGLALTVKTFSFPWSPFCLYVFNIQSHKENSFVLKVFSLGFLISSLFPLGLQSANRPLVCIRLKNTWNSDLSQEACY